MSTSAKIILDKRSWSKKANGHPISVEVTNKTNRLVSQKVYALESQWNGYEVTSDHPNASEINRFLTERRAKLIKEVDYCNKHKLDLAASIKIIKNGLDDKEIRIAQLERELRELKGDNQTMLFKFWKDFIKEMAKIEKDTKALEDTLIQFQNYTLNQDIPINNINYEFLKDFSTYKLSGECNQPGLNHYLSMLRRVYKAAQSRESLKIKSSNPFTGFITNDKRSKVVEMSPEEMLAWVKYEPHPFTTKKSAISQKRRRDLFVFQFLIGGHDFADIAVLEWKNIRGDRIRFKRYKNRSHKSGGPLVDNLILPLAKQIIQLHGTTDRDRVFAFIPHPRDKRSYFHFQNNTRRCFRAISNQLELQDVVKTKSPRYIFKSWADDLELDLRSINQVQGRSQKTLQGVAADYGARLHNSKADHVINSVTSRIGEKP